MANPRAYLEMLEGNPRAGLMAVRGLTALCVAVSVVSIGWWLRIDPVRGLAAEVPGNDGRDKAAEGGGARIDLAGVFTPGPGAPSALPGAWPHFRGPDSTNVVADAPPLAAPWPGGAPKLLWSVPVGEGYAAPAVWGGCVYLMDYDVPTRSDVVRCLSLDDGREVWRRAYKNNIKRNHGMSRTIPAVTEEFLVVIGPKCHVLCLDRKTGEYKWGIDMQRDFGTEEPLWYTAQCPIVDGGRAILAPGSPDALMMAVDCATGETAWKAPNPDGWKMSHASVIPMTLLGRRMYVYGALGGMAAVSEAGETLWSIPWDAKVVAPSPVKVADDAIFVTAGYGRGSRLLKLRDEGGKIAVEVVYDRPPGEILSCEQQTPVFHDGLLYGILPKDAGALKGQMACYKPDGTLVWSSGSDHRFGLGPFLLANGKFYVLDDEGVLSIVEAKAEGFSKIAEADVLEGHDAWGPLALAGSRMLMRDMNNLACVELGAGV